MVILVGSMLECREDGLPQNGWRVKLRYTGTAKNDAGCTPVAPR